MNRTLKFRVWNKKTSEWVHGPGKEVDLLGETILFGNFMKDVPLRDQNECVVLQYTGLQDHYGADIYEGDILEELRNNEIELGVGVCKGVLGGWKIFATDDCCWHGWKQRVIGNIFDNSDLVKNI